MSFLAEDRQRLEAFRRGEKETLGLVYRHYAAALSRRLAGGIQLEAGNQRLRAELNGWCDIEAILQETFVRAFSPKARGAYDGLRPYSAFLLGVARNVLLDEYRRHRRTSSWYLAW